MCVGLAQTWIHTCRSASCDVGGVVLSRGLGNLSPSVTAYIRSPAPVVNSHLGIHQIRIGAFFKEALLVEQAQIQRPKERRFLLVKLTVSLLWESLKGASDDLTLLTRKYFTLRIVVP